MIRVVRVVSYVAAAMLVVLLAAVLLGWYPVAIADGSVVTYQRWVRATRAAEHFAAVRGSHAGVDAFRPEQRSYVVHRNTLAFLIEDRILAHAGRERIDGFEGTARERVVAALEETRDAEYAARAVYGLSKRGYVNLVLRPQARSDLMQEDVEAAGGDFIAWFEDRRKRAEVALFLVPFVWNEGELE